MRPIRMSDVELKEAYKRYQEKQLLTHSTMRICKIQKKRFDNLRHGEIAKVRGLNKLNTNDFMKIVLDIYERHIG